MSSKLEKELLPLGNTPRQPKPRSRLATAAALTIACSFWLWSTAHWSNVSVIPRNPAYLIKAEHGVVATENVLCSRIGVNILKAGGNAVDSAIATAFCIGTINMFSSGIGGGGFMTIRIPPANVNASSEVFTIDFRETAPALSNTTMFHDNPVAAMFGGLSVGVPSEIRGFEEAHRRWGSLPWKDLLAPSIHLASGWKVDAELERRIKMFDFLMLGHDDWQPTFAPEGKLLKKGDWIHRKAYAETLRRIADEGPDAFYSGPIADAIIAKVHTEGGILTHQDLLDYKVIVRKALQGEYRGKKVYTTDAPTSGPVFLHILNLLDNFDLQDEGRTSLNIHRFIEALKFSFGARTRLSDPDFTNQTKIIQMIPTKEFASLVLANITDDKTHPPEYYNPEFAVQEDHGTAHISVVDKNEMAVALTSTINLVFGSWVHDQKTGIIFNDEMDDFSIPDVPNGFGLYPSPYNFPEPGKRPLSSIVPTIIENPDGTFYMAIGGSGGSRIYGAVVQTMLNLDWGLDLSAAIEYGRVHDQLYPLLVDVDDVFPTSFLADLKARGHNITVTPVQGVKAVINAVSKQNGSYWGASDSRKNGIAAGY